MAPLAARGVRHFVYTDVDRDGMLGGIDAAAVARVADAVEGELLYSGGHRLARGPHGARARFATRGSRGAIVGKALYEGRFTLAEAEAALCS